MLLLVYRIYVEGNSKKNLKNVLCLKRKITYIFIRFEIYVEYIDKFS
jgi:hypothetical protein